MSEKIKNENEKKFESFEKKLQKSVLKLEVNKKSEQNILRN